MDMDCRVYCMMIVRDKDIRHLTKLTMGDTLGKHLKLLVLSITSLTAVSSILAQIRVLLKQSM